MVNREGNTRQLDRIHLPTLLYQWTRDMYSVCMQRLLPQLFLDDSFESTKAITLLRSNGNGKRVEILLKGKDFKDCDFQLPALFSSSGIFRGLSQIEIFLNSHLE